MPAEESADWKVSSILGKTKLVIEVKFALSLVTKILDEEWTLILTLESDCAPGGGAAKGLSASAGGDLGTGKLMSPP